MLRNEFGDRRIAATFLVALIVIAGLWLFLSESRLTLLPAEPTVSQTELSTSRETLTTTSTVTSTPRAEISLEYAITIQDPRSGRIHVTGIIHNPEGDHVVLGRGQPGGSGRQVPPMTNFLPSPAYVPGSGNFLEVVSLSVDGKTEVRFEYDADLSPRVVTYGYHWYLDGEFGVVTPEQLIFYPLTSSQERYISIHNITIRFQLPEGWELLTRWERRGDHYRARSTPEFILGFLGFGIFSKASRDISGTNVTTAFTGIPEIRQNRLSDLIFTLYGYYTTKLGPMIDSTYLPRGRYVVLFVPSPDGRLVSSDRTWGFYRSYHEDEQDIAHEIFHEWNSDSGAFFGDGFLTEGLTTYYEYHALLKTGLWTRERYYQGLISEYSEYQHKIAGTSNDVSLEPQRSSIDWDLYYRKGAVVGYLLNEEMSKVTDAKRDMDDLMRYLFEHWATQKSKSDEWPNFAYDISGEELLKAVNELTGHDFGNFFGAYVFGVAPLPLTVQAGQIWIRYGELPPVPALGS